MRKKKIVIVDDDILLLKTMNIYLNKKGYDVTVFCNGTEAIMCSLEEKPDLLVLDIRLPDCDGWSLAKILEKHEWAKNVPLIIISACDPDRAKISEVKPYAYIQKPFEMEQLVQTVERSLAGETSLNCI
jgi:DNA-binding response OmpR family regulator